MKIFYRIGYAVLVTFFFLWALNFVSGLRMTLYVQDKGNAALAEENPTYHFFYSAIPDYHRSIPLFSYDDGQYAVRLFEIATADVSGLDLTVAEYGYLMIHPKNGSTAEVYTVELWNQDQAVSEFSAIQYRNLNLLVGINQEGSVYLDKSLFQTSSPERLVLKDAAGTILLDIPFSPEDFTIGGRLSDFFGSEGDLPEGLELENASLFPANPQIDDEYAYLFWLILGGYLILVTITTYFLFFFKKGRTTPKKEPDGDTPQTPVSEFPQE